MSRTPITAMRRVFQRPRPWVLRYLLHLLPAVLMALLIAGPLLPIFRRPLTAEAMRTRSLGLLFEVLRAPELAGAPALGLAALVGALLAWLPVQIAALWLEGGVLFTYAGTERPDGRTFRRACGRTFGSFLLIGAAQTVLGLLLAALGAGLSAGMGFTGFALTGVAIGVGAGLGAVGLLGEVSRIAIVVRDDRHILRALRSGFRLIRTRGWTVAALAGGSLVVHALLFAAQRAAGRAIPLELWLLSLLVMQGLQFLGAGVRLTRQAGVVATAEALWHEETPDG